MIPIAGSAYTYSYATMGEVVAWIIGWDLVLEYALGAATVSIAWSEYLNNLLTYIHIGGYQLHIPYNLSHSPFDSNPLTGEHGIINIPALVIIGLLSFILIRGTKESARVNNIIVVVKVSIVIIFILLGWAFMKVANHTPYIPPNNGHFGEFGWTGILRGAGIVFFAFIGFDAVSTTAQEAKNPQKDMPIGILGSLVVCTILYILVSLVLTGLVKRIDPQAVAAQFFDRASLADVNGVLA